MCRLLSERSDKDHWHIAFAPHRLTNLQSFQLRHHHVQYQQVETAFLRECERLLAVIGWGDAHARRAEKVLHERRECPVVLRQKNVSRHVHPLLFLLSV